MLIHRFSSLPPVLLEGLDKYLRENAPHPDKGVGLEPISVERITFDLLCMASIALLEIINKANETQAQTQNN